MDGSRVVIPTASIALELHQGTVDTPPVTTISNGDQAVIKVTGTSTGAALTNVQVDNIVYWSNAGGIAGPQMTIMADGVCSSSKCTENSITTQSVGADTAEISFVANCGAGSLVLFEQGVDSTVQWTFQIGQPTKASKSAATSRSPLSKSTPSPSTPGPTLWMTLRSLAPAPLHSHSRHSS